MLFLRRPNIRPNQEWSLCSNVISAIKSIPRARQLLMNEFYFTLIEMNICSAAECHAYTFFLSPARDINCRSQNIPTINRFHSQLIRHLARITSSSSSSSSIDGSQSGCSSESRRENENGNWLSVPSQRQQHKMMSEVEMWKRKKNVSFSFLFRPSRSGRTNSSPRTVNKMMGGFGSFFSAATTSQLAKPKISIKRRMEERKTN